MVTFFIAINEGPVKLSGSSDFLEHSYAGSESESSDEYSAIMIDVDALHEHSGRDRKK